MSDRPEWFAPKRYGLGTGLPIAWQGWALLLSFLAICFGTAYLLHDKPLLMFAVLFPFAAVFVLVSAFTTRGGWRWRWGEKE